MAKESTVSLLDKIPAAAAARFADVHPFRHLEDVSVGYALQHVAKTLPMPMDEAGTARLADLFGADHVEAVMDVIRPVYVEYWSYVRDRIARRRAQEIEWARDGGFLRLNYNDRTVTVRTHDFEDYDDHRIFIWKALEGGDIVVRDDLNPYRITHVIVPERTTWKGVKPQEPA